MYSYSEILNYIKESNQLPQLTDNPKVNFLIDKAVDERIGINVSNREWDEENKKTYKEEVDRLEESDFVDITPAESLDI